MSKADTLLKKATFFERMALYSDRKAFLQSLAGGATDDWGPQAATDAQIKASLQEVNNAIQQWLGQYAEKQADLPGGLKGMPRSVSGAAAVVRAASEKPSFTVQDLQQVYPALRTLSAVANIRDMGDDARNGWTQVVFPVASKTMETVGRAASAIRNSNIPPPPAETEEGSGTFTIPEVQVQGRPALPPINKADQAALAEYVMTNGMGFVDPAKMQDGVLGPETRKALEAVKNYFAKKNPQNKRMTDQEAIRAAKFQGR